MKRKTLLLLIFLGFVFGVFCAETLLYFNLNPGYAFIAGIIPLFAFKPKQAILISAMIALGIFRSLSAVHIPTENNIDYYAQPAETAENVHFQGIITEIPEKRPGKTRLIITAEKYKNKEVQGKVLVNVSQLPEYNYGDRVEFYGKLENPPVWEDFSYKNYLAKDEIFAYSPWASASLINSNNGSLLYRNLYKLRMSFEENLERIIPRPESSFARGILLGSRSSFSENMIEDFNRAGLTHLLALSGFNITIIIIALFWALRFLPKKLAMISTITAVVLFILLTGAGASVVRAGIMGLVGLFALHSGRETKSFFVLILAIFLMILWNPKTLLFDAGFQLSVAGVIGIIAFVPYFEKKRFFRALPETFGFRHAVLATVSAQIAVAPLSAFYFDSFSIVAPLANPLIAPLIPVCMLLSFLTAILAYFSNFLAYIVGFIAYNFLKIALLVPKFFGNLPFAQITISNFLPIILLILVFFFLFFLAVRKNP